MPPQIKKATNALLEGNEILLERNKHLIIADKSEGGWATVEEYVQRDIADDSDDDRRLRKAESAVMKKRELKLKKKAFKPWKQNNYSFRGPTTTENKPSGGAPTYTPYNSQFRRERRICFGCHQIGHLRKDCTATTDASGQAIPRVNSQRE